MDTQARVDEVAIRRHRLQRVREGLTAEDLDAVVLLDPINVRYATGSRNMQVWTMHHAMRYAFIPATGPVILFDYPGSLHLSEGLETIDQRRTATGWDHFASGPRTQDHAERWAAEISDLLAEHGGKGRRLAVDRADLPIVRALDARKVSVLDAKPMMSLARAIKSHEEIAAMRRSLEVCSQSIVAMREGLEPGVTEQEVLARLISENVRRGGEYPETRLLASGPRTNPWYQETSDRALENGDLLAFDTDLIGPYGFFTDVSRTWLVGDRRPTDHRRRLYELAFDQLQHNTELLTAGTGFLELTDKAWTLPDAYVANRYAELAHGAGLSVEYPIVYYPQDVEGSGYDGVLQENMVICAESYIGAEHEPEGVKLEQPVLITRSSPQPLCDYPFESDLL
jgi:Xaa-Pro aminopeptidase